MSWDSSWNPFVLLLVVVRGAAFFGRQAGLERTGRVRFTAEFKVNARVRYRKLVNIGALLAVACQLVSRHDVLCLEVFGPLFKDVFLRAQGDVGGRVYEIYKRYIYISYAMNKNAALTIFWANCNREKWVFSMNEMNWNSFYETLL